MYACHVKFVRKILYYINVLCKYIDTQKTKTHQAHNTTIQIVCIDFRKSKFNLEPHQVHYHLNGYRNYEFHHYCIYGQ